MATIKVRFDGRVFVPEGPVQLPVGFQAEIPLSVPGPAPAVSTLEELAALGRTLPDNPSWPADGAGQVDHYLFGLPKQP